MNAFQTTGTAPRHDEPPLCVSSLLALIAVNKPPPGSSSLKGFLPVTGSSSQTGARKGKGVLTARRIKVKRSKNQPQKPVLQAKVAQTQKSRYVKRKPRAHCECEQLPVYQQFSLTLHLFFITLRPLSRS
jgi:hypothetical protein